MAKLRRILSIIFWKNRFNPFYSREMELLKELNKHLSTIPKEPEELHKHRVILINGFDELGEFMDSKGDTMKSSTYKTFADAYRKMGD